MNFYQMFPYLLFRKEYSSAFEALVHFTAPPELNARIEQVAHKKKISKSELIRIAIQEFLKDEE